MKLARDTLFWCLSRLALAGSLLVRALELFAAALLSRSELRRRVAERWESFNRTGLALSQEQLPWETDFYERQLEPGQRVLVIGCGAGRDVLTLLARGARVDGFDITPKAVETAGRRVSEAGYTASLFVAAAEDRPPLPERYDWVLFSFYCYNYIVGSEGRIQALEYAREHLAPGGRVFLSYIPRPPGVRFRLARAAGLFARWTGNDWAPAPGDVVTLVSPGSRSPAVSYEHHFEPWEVVEEVARSGLRVVSHEIRDRVSLLIAEGP